MRGKYKLIADIPVADLQLDPNNFRIGNAESQRECVALMLADKNSREQIIHLAKDISTRGLSPMPIIVTKSGDGKYTVKDGNRRITALKLLNNPSEAPDNYRATFSSIAQNANFVITSTIDCYTTDDSSALEFMELAHLGYQDGVGQIPWGSNEKDNLMEFKGEKPQNDVARAVLSYLKNLGIDGTDKVKITIFQRLFQDKQVRDTIGIDWNGSQVTPVMDEKDVANILSEILLDFTERNYITRNIFTAEDRLNYLEELFARGIPKPNPMPAPSTGGVAGPQPTPPPSTPPSIPIPPPTSVPPGTYPPAKPTWDRKRLIPRYSYLSIPKTSSKAYNIANELAREVEVKKAPNAVAVLLRLLIEFSVENYTNKYSLVPNRDTLANRIKMSAKKLHDETHISQKQKELLEKMSNSDEILSAHTLNQWIHNPSYSPSPQTLCNFWDNINFFINLCWTK